MLNSKVFDIPMKLCLELMAPVCQYLLYYRYLIVIEIIQTISGKKYQVKRKATVILVQFFALHLLCSSKGCVVDTLRNWWFSFNYAVNVQKK
jgi:hypothetical protein